MCLQVPKAHTILFNRGDLFFSPDDRFILKQVKSIEISSFELFAPHYLKHVTKALEDKVINWNILLDAMAFLIL